MTASSTATERTPMDTVPHSTPPPKTWKLKLKLRKDRDPTALIRAHRIIISFLESSQRQLRRVEKGVAEFELTSVGWPVDHSIFTLVKNETSADLEIEAENPTW